jgi:hypothetical protein
MNPFRTVLPGAIAVFCSSIVAATDGSAQEECTGRNCMPAPQQCSGENCAETLDNPVERCTGQDCTPKPEPEPKG